MKNITVFVAGVTVIAWAANYLASVLGAGDPALASVGMSVAAMGPLVMAIVLRRRANEGWANAGLKTRFGQNKLWYGFSLLYIPVVIGLVAAMALSLEVAEITPDPGDAMDAIVLTFSITFGPMLLLSIGEEFGWRGYLEPALRSVNSRVVLNHIFIGLVWGFWHFPVLLFAPASETDPVQLLMVVVGCVALAVIYGQLRWRSESVWPCVILHAISNTTFISVGSSKALLFDDGVKDIISFNTTSVAVVGIWILTCLWLLSAIRTNPASPVSLGHLSR